VQNLSFENVFDLNESQPVGGTHYHMTGFAQRRGLTQKKKVTWKWLIEEVMVQKVKKEVSKFLTYYFLTQRILN